MDLLVDDSGSFSAVHFLYFCNSSAQIPSDFSGIMLSAKLMEARTLAIALAAVWSLWSNILPQPPSRRRRGDGRASSGVPAGGRNFGRRAEFRPSIRRLRGRRSMGGPARRLAASSAGKPPSPAPPWPSAAPASRVFPRNGAAGQIGRRL